MPIETELLLTPEVAASAEAVAAQAIRQSGYPENSPVRTIRRSIDARQRQVRIRLVVQVYHPAEPIAPSHTSRTFERANPDRRVIIVGAGPAGLYAALHLLTAGITPVILERGKDVRSRRRDLAAIHKAHQVNPDSNYCFGEGGAGTYSDGKLYTRSTKRGDVQSVLNTLVQFGASPDILIDAHPHVGTNKLPGIITSMREAIIAHGGEVHFESAVEDILTAHGVFEGAVTRNGVIHRGQALILATGHSARDIFHLFSRKQWAIEFKSFALGVRAEHPQQIIDRIQYHCDSRGEFLPPASYSLVHNAGKKSAFSFCMCPGGIIAPCATEQHEVVTNGWSPSKRNNPWANSGIVVPVDWNDVSDHHASGALAGMAFQRAVEHAFWKAGGGTQAAPAQRMTDFTEGRLSQNLPDCSYQPGIVSARLDQILPPFIAQTLREGFIQFGKKMRGYYTEDALLVGPESRTSSPVRIPRDKETLEHPDIRGLYPCGEGAGYAGGIVSAAMDGERCAEHAARLVLA